MSILGEFSKTVNFINEEGEFTKFKTEDIVTVEVVEKKNSKFSYHYRIEYTCDFYLMKMQILKHYMVYKISLYGTEEFVISFEDWLTEKINTLKNRQMTVTMKEFVDQACREIGITIMDHGNLQFIN